MPRDKRYSSPQWKRLRLLALNRSNWTCEIDHPNCRYKLPGSLKTAPKLVAQVDHIISPYDEGSFWDEHNLRASCRAGNVGLRNIAQNRRAAADVARRRGEPVLSPNGGQPIRYGPSRVW